MNWKPLLGPYEVSDEGQIRHMRTGRIRRPKTLPPWGYLQVTLYVDGAFVYEYVHRAVLKAFVGPCPEGQQARHLNGDRNDNRLENLAWGTPLENAADTIRHGRQQRGEDRPGAKLTEENVRAIRAAAGRHADIAAPFGISTQLVGQIKRGEKWAWLS